MAWYSDNRDWWERARGPGWADYYERQYGRRLAHQDERHAAVGAKAVDGPKIAIGTGPYKVTEFKPNDVVLYEINENYRDPGKPFRALAWLVAAGAVLALFLHWLPVLPQRNAHWIALLLPIHIALAWTLAGCAKRAA